MQELAQLNIAQLNSTRVDLRPVDSGANWFPRRECLAHLMHEKRSELSERRSVHMRALQSRKKIDVEGNNNYVDNFIHSFTYLFVPLELTSTTYLIFVQIKFYDF